MQCVAKQKSNVVSVNNSRCDYTLNFYIQCGYSSLSWALRRYVELYKISIYTYIIFLTNKSALVSMLARLCCSYIVNDYYTFFLNDLLCNRCCNEDSVVWALIDIYEDALYMYNLRDYIDKSLLRGIFDVISTRWDGDLQRCEPIYRKSSNTKRRQYFR